MAQFRDLDEFLVTPPIQLPISGKTYEFPGSIPAKVGLVLQRMELISATSADRQAAAAAGGKLAAELIAEDPDFNLQRTLMGGREDEMVADGLSNVHLARVFQTLMVWHLHGEDAAQQTWERQTDQGEAPAPNRAARRQKARSTTRSPGSTAADSATPTPASSTGTSTSTASSRAKRPAKASPGRTSSNAGRS